ncbi:hypothetical protein [Flavobacterium sp.]|uniref:hypothetical protein n=1 Tax=Flavobacterium sp. TaxID=239 RepID=UPI002614FA10|nr:hypothetical protein [Flavobacterium sp.]
MKVTKSKPSKTTKTKQKKREEIQYQFLIAVLVIGLIHYFFIESKYIGGDYRYDLFVFWIPVIVGFLLIVKFNILSIDWKDILTNIRKEKNIFHKIIYLPLLFLVHFMLAVMYFWIPANIIFDGINKIESNKNVIETYTLKVHEFHHSSGRSGSTLVRFIFKGEKEHIKVSYEDIKPYLDKNPNDFQISIEVKKGIWNYYILENWDIKELLEIKSP